MHHHDEHHHHHVSGRKLLWSILLNSLITIAQIIGGLASGSLAVLSDAFHNLSDVLGLIVSYYAHKIVHKPHDYHRTFGFKRAEIIAGLFNASLLLGVSIYLIVEAINRFEHPQIVNGNWVVFLASLGVFANGLSAYFLHNDAHNNLNIRSAYLHLMGDLMSSVAVLVGGFIMMSSHLYWIDAALSIMISLYLIKSSYAIVVETIEMLMQFAPKHIKIEEVIKRALEFEEIDNIHHIHIWQLNDSTVFLEAHVKFKQDLLISQTNEILDKLECSLNSYGINHITLQPVLENMNEHAVWESCAH